MTLTSHEKQIVLGTLLGTSCLRRHPKGRHHSLYMRSGDDHNWFRVKCHYLSRFARDSSDEMKPRWESQSDEMWDEYHAMCYGNKKLITMNWLDPLTDDGFATWFLDKGGVSGNRAYIRVANLEGHDVLAEYLEIVGLPCQIKKKMVVFDPQVTQRFLKMITPCFPQYLLSRPTPYRTRKYL